MKLTKTQQSTLAFLFGVVFVVVLLVIAIGFPTPTPFQYTVFRIVLALAAAGVAAMIPGFISVEFKTWVKAGGALAVFVIVYFVNPASLLTTAIIPQPKVTRFEVTQANEGKWNAVLSVEDGGIPPEAHLIAAFSGDPKLKDIWEEHTLKRPVNGQVIGLDARNDKVVYVQVLVATPGGERVQKSDIKPSSVK